MIKRKFKTYILWENEMILYTKIKLIKLNIEKIK